MSLAVQVGPARCGRVALAVALLAIVSSLLMTHLNPKRFRIHPLPYLSDAGLRDPERIVLSFGMFVSAVLLGVVVLGQYLHQMKRLEFQEKADWPGRFGKLSTTCEWTATAGYLAAVALTSFASIPGWWFLHHIVTAIFAVSAATWTILGTYVESKVVESSSSELDTENSKIRPLKLRRLRSKYSLGMIVFAVVACFAMLWATIRLEMPPMIPNTDRRFIAMALLEYLGVSAFLRYVHLVTCDISDVQLEITPSHGYPNSRV